MEGNTVRKLNALPDIRREEQREVIQPSPRRQDHRQPKTISGISFTSLLVLTVAIVTTLYTCVEYLKAHTEVSRMEKQIVSLERDLITLKNQNDATFEQIDSAYDLAYVYEIAVNELGMIYPNKNTIITFQKSKVDYMRQYEDIPEAKDKNLLERIMQ